ncbi:hypothetical protein SAMN04488005_2936 [Yoonia tamlensis]|uniref:MYXO-CTERM domain-containing protein n=1 Tax=Yoonia tamlensis TaxID=390270 RepID=A0A1I6HQ84_9RHOB|nr:hypothetical protein [Yoonia tamlensis]SFR56548.1 hypothetical protein SAMN04488005_2936 [Yoonia tamlensis]
MFRFPLTALVTAAVLSIPVTTSAQPMPMPAPTHEPKAATNTRGPAINVVVAVAALGLVAGVVAHHRR